MNRRSAIEPVISHLKHDHNMVRNFLKGKEGDRINAILSAAGFNFSKLIRAFFVISKILSFHRFYFQFESCFFSFPQNLNFSGTTIYALALYLGYTSLRKEKCVDCNKILTEADAYFHSNDYSEVLKAVEKVDTTPLNNLTRVKDQPEKTILRLRHCDDCHEIAVGRLSQEDFVGRSNFVFIIECLSHAASGFISLVEAHLAYRGEE